jgi:hypothetical protein
MGLTQLIQGLGIGDSMMPHAIIRIKRFISTRKLEGLAVLFLVITTLAAYSRVGTFGYVFFDDDVYVFNNTHIRQGLTLENIVWCLKGTHANNWHPLTTMSLLLDYTLFGDNPGRSTS